LPYTHQQGLEFWYDFDKQTKYDPALVPTLNAAGASQVQAQWHTARHAGTYPRSFVMWATPRAAAWRSLVALQRSIFEAHLGSDVAAVQSAFEDFGQGTLLDEHPERIDNGDAVHMMDTGATPPVGYHRWHASVRVCQLLGLTDTWWDVLTEFIGLAWAIQSLARPVQGVAANRPLPIPEVAALRTAWLNIPADRLDRQYDLGTGQSGYHPSPTQPVP
jgi:hypothetical protein